MFQIHHFTESEKVSLEKLEISIHFQILYILN